MTRVQKLDDARATETDDGSVPTWVTSSPIADHRYIFVGGLHRSGTTALFKVIRNHPMVSGFRIAGGAEREHEGQMHQTVYPSGRATGGPGYFSLDHRSFIDETSVLATPANAEKLFSEWARLWDLSKPYLLEKSPPNLVRTRFLQRLFPNTYFVTIARHPIAVSLATMKWMGWPRFVVAPENERDDESAYSVRPATKDDVEAFHGSQRLHTESMLYTLFCHWEAGYGRYLEDAPFLERRVLLRYEDFVADPIGMTERLLHFLDLPVADPDPSSFVTNHNERYFDEWASLPEDVLRPAFRRFVVNRFEDFMRPLGYQLASDDYVVRPADSGAVWFK